MEFLSFFPLFVQLLGGSFLTGMNGPWMHFFRVQKSVNKQASVGKMSVRKGACSSKLKPVWWCTNELAKNSQRLRIKGPPKILSWRACQMPSSSLKKRSWLPDYGQIALVNLSAAQRLKREEFLFAKCKGNTNDMTDDWTRNLVRRIDIHHRLT